MCKRTFRENTACTVIVKSIVSLEARSTNFLGQATLGQKCSKGGSK